MIMDSLWRFVLKCVLCIQEQRTAHNSPRLVMMTNIGMAGAYDATWESKQVRVIKTKNDLHP